MFEIYCYGNLDSLNGIFNAVAAIMQTGDFMDLIRVVALIGVLVALFTGLFNPAKFTGWGWFAGFVALYFFMFVPKVNVQLIDKLNGSPPIVVGNVPIGLAAFGHFTSKVGDWATRSYETVMQPLGLPDPLKYQNNGLLFGNKVISASRQVAIVSPQLKTDLVNFVYNCTMYDLADNSINPNAFATSLDIWALMGTTNPARFTTFGTAPSTIGSCQTAYTYLNNQLPAEINRARSMLALEMNPLRNPASVTTALIDDQVQQSHFRYRIATGAQTATDLLRQNAMINIMRDSANVIGQKMNDPATVMLANAQAQAVASTNANFVSQGKLAEQALPMLRNVIEAIIYAVFPIMFIFFLTLQGPALITAIKSFFLALIWVQLWPPLYAVLNYMGTMSSARTLEAAANFGGGAGLTLDTANSIYSGAISDQAVIGYMAISIPLFASALVFGMNKLGSLGAATFLGAATRATEAAGSGNISMGNQTMDQTRIDPSMTDPSMRTDSNAFGASTSQITPSGSSLAAYKSNLSNLSTAIDITSKDAETMGETAKATQAIATQQIQSAAESSVASALQAISIIDKHIKSGEQSSGSNSMATGGQSSAVSFVNDTAREIQNVLGKNVSAEAAQKMAAAIGVTAEAYAKGEGWVKAAAGGDNPLFSAQVGAMGSVGMKVGADGSLRFENSNLSKETLSALDQVANKARESKQLSEGMSYIKNFSTSDAYRWAQGNATDAAKNYDASYARGVKSERTASKLHTDARQQEQVASVMREMSTIAKTDLANAIVPILADRGQLEERDPLKMRQYAVEAAGIVLQNGGFVNGRLAPGDGLSKPLPTPGSYVSNQGTTAADYQGTTVPGDISMPAEVAGGVMSEVRDRQRAAGLAPGSKVSNSVPNAASEIAKARQAIGDEGGRIKNDNSKIGIGVEKGMTRQSASQPSKFEYNPETKRVELNSKGMLNTIADGTGVNKLIDDVKRYASADN